MARPSKSDTSELPGQETCWTAAGKPFGSSHGRNRRGPFTTTDVVSPTHVGQSGGAAGNPRSPGRAVSPTAEHGLPGRSALPVRRSPPARPPPGWASAAGGLHEVLLRLACALPDPRRRGRRCLRARRGTGTEPRSHARHDCPALFIDPAVVQRISRALCRRPVCHDGVDPLPRPFRHLRCDCDLPVGACGLDRRR